MICGTDHEDDMREDHEDDMRGGYAGRMIFGEDDMRDG